ncbi:MAG: hypothetical protein DRH17_11890 [Deltaproteobacteria bacterium]|nr:MAG: hypothetical protein DRH17_11890 [Deltaproteobacteria bacterium]
MKKPYLGQGFIELALSLGNDFWGSFARRPSSFFTRSTRRRQERSLLPGLVRTIVQVVVETSPMAKETARFVG